MPSDLPTTTRLQGEPALAVHRTPGPGPSLLYVHGATFPSALSVGYRIEGRSWADDLSARGLDVWSFDFAGFGGSDPPLGLDGPSPVGEAPDAAAQIERVVDHIRAATGRERVSILAHSWGTLPAGLFAARAAERVERLALFGPIARREGPPATKGGGSALFSAQDQRASFRSGPPPGLEDVFASDLFEAWAAQYLASDPASATRTPPAVRVPAGPQADIARAWAGEFPYDPSQVRARTLIVYGEWDYVTGDDGARWLATAFGESTRVEVMRLPRGAHRMHLEANRQTLFDAVGGWLLA